MLLLIPPTVVGQDLTMFSNGTIANAESINENFSLLWDKVASERHPSGDLFFRHDDEFTLSTVVGPSALEEATNSVLLEEWGAEIYQWSGPQYIYRQAGVTFFRTFSTRNFPATQPNSDLCPSNTVATVPIEFYEVFHNQFGVIIQGTDWDLGEDNVPTPQNINTNPSGSYLCLFSDGTYLANLNIQILSATGRYKCAKSFGGRALIRQKATETISISGTRVEGLPSLEFSAELYNERNYSPALISADIPEICDAAEAINKLTGSRQHNLAFRDLFIERPAIQR